MSSYQKMCDLLVTKMSYLPDHPKTSCYTKHRDSSYKNSTTIPMSTLQVPIDGFGADGTVTFDSIFESMLTLLTLINL